jgi:hypothetical protein
MVHKIFDQLLKQFDTVIGQAQGAIVATTQDVSE